MRIPFTYRGFHDVPRAIRFPFGGKWYFLCSEFDEKQDEYTDFYDVYLLPFSTEDELELNPYYWTDLDRADSLGRIPIAEIGLDETRRASIDGKRFAEWLSESGHH